MQFWLAIGQSYRIWYCYLFWKSL